ncbi:response regulator transcription factor [Patescibacteria group bacterium]
MRILIIEDDKDMTNLLKSGLCAECFVVDVSSDGESGEFLALTNDYDLIILDNMLPKKSGQEICRTIRKKGNNIPIIMISVKSDVASKVSLLSEGVDDYLTKPFSFEELLARIHAILRRPGGMRGDVLEVGHISIDLKKHIIKKNSKVINLTLKEFMLLELLMRNAGQVVSRGMIWDHVWDSSVDPFSNTVESHMRSLRMKLGCKSRNNVIETVSGRGYRMKCDE